MRPKLIILLFAFFLAPQYAIHGQFNFREGRIITLDNDTLSGLISDRGTIRNSRVCRFKENRKAAVRKYYPGDIRSYRFIGDTYYASKNLFVDNDFRQSFIEVIIEGKVNLYHYYKGNEVRYFIEKDGGDFIGLINERYYLGKPGNSNVTVYWHEYVIENSIYKDTLRYLFSDCPAVVNQLYGLDYNFKSLKNFTREYIRQTCTGDGCITYERDLRKRKDRAGFYAGVQFSKIYYSGYSVLSRPDIAFPFGLLYSIPLTQLSPKLSFQTELTGRYLEFRSDYELLPDDFQDKDISTWILGMPLLIRYNITQRRVSPYLGVGKELSLTLDPEVEFTTITGYSEGLPVYTLNHHYLHRFQKGGWFFDAGLNFEINPYYSLYVNLRFQRNINKIIPHKYQDNFIFKNAEGEEFDTNLVALQVGFMFR